jgi:hypothetical protein
MTVSSTNRAAGPFLGNGVVTVFPFDFKTDNASELTVTRRNAAGTEIVEAPGVNYTVSLNADQQNSPGGTVTRTPALPTGETLTISSQLAFTQGVDLVNLGGFFPDIIEGALDRVTLLTQQVNDNLTRTIRVPITDGLAGTLTLPTAVARANKVLAFDATGTPVAGDTSPVYLPTIPDQTSNAGKYLSTNGTSTNWADVVIPTPIFNTLQAFTSSGSYTPAAGVTRVFVEVWGGGGGGGGAVLNNRISAGGGGGGYTCGFINVTPGVPITVNVGAGGTGGADTGANGTNGGTSSFGALSATGGLGGTGSGAGSSDGLLFTGGDGGTGSGGTLNLSGERGGNAYFAYTPPSSTAYNADWLISRGGDAPRGGIGGRLTEAQVSTSVAGNAPGGGGTGCRTGAATSGGNGANGLVLVWRP